MNLQTMAYSGIGLLLIVGVLLTVSSIVHTGLHDGIVATYGNCTYLGNGTNESLNTSAECPMTPAILNTKNAQNATLNFSSQNPTIGTLIGVSIIAMVVIFGMIALIKKGAI